MRTTGTLVGLAVMLGLTLPAAAGPSDLAQVAQQWPAVHDGMGSGGNRPEMQAPGRPGGWRRGFGPPPGHPRPFVIRMALMNRQELGLTAQQVDSLRRLGLDFWRAAIRRNADLQIAQVDLLGLRLSDAVDIGRVEAKVREIERLKGDGRIAAFRTAEDAKAQLTADQREKLRNLWAARWQRRGSGEGGAEEPAASDDGS